MNKKRLFDKNSLKSIILEALFDENINAMLKTQYKKGNSESDFFYQTACNIAEEITKRFYE